MLTLMVCLLYVRFEDSLFIPVYFPLCFVGISCICSVIRSHSLAEGFPGSLKRMRLVGCVSHGQCSGGSGKDPLPCAGGREQGEKRDV